MMAMATEHLFILLFVFCSAAMTEHTTQEPSEKATETRTAATFETVPPYYSQLSFDSTESSEENTTDPVTSKTKIIEVVKNAAPPNDAEPTNNPIQTATETLTLTLETIQTENWEKIKSTTETIVENTTGARPDTTDPYQSTLKPSNPEDYSKSNIKISHNEKQTTEGESKFAEIPQITNENQNTKAKRETDLEESEKNNKIPKESDLTSSSKPSKHDEISVLDQTVIEDNNQGQGGTSEPSPVNSNEDKDSIKSKTQQTKPKYPKEYPRTSSKNVNLNSDKSRETFKDQQKPSTISKSLENTQKSLPQKIHSEPSPINSNEDENSIKSKTQQTKTKHPKEYPRTSSKNVNLNSDKSRQTFKDQQKPSTISKSMENTQKPSPQKSRTSQGRKADETLCDVPKEVEHDSNSEHDDEVKPKYQESEEKKSDIQEIESKISQQVNNVNVTIVPPVKKTNKPRLETTTNLITITTSTTQFLTTMKPSNNSSYGKSTVTGTPPANGKVKKWKRVLDALGQITCVFTLFGGAFYLLYSVM